MTFPPYRRTVVLLFAAATMAATALVPYSTGAAAQSRYEFLAPPSTTSNRIYRVDTQTGAMGVCWFNGTHTECMNGTGLAGPQERGRYTLRRSESASEKGVFRVETTSGAVSNCWIKQGTLVCTFPVR